MEEIDIRAFKTSHFRGNFTFEIVGNWENIKLS